MRGLAELKDIKHFSVSYKSQLLLIRSVAVLCSLSVESPDLSPRVSVMAYLGHCEGFCCPCYPIACPGESVWLNLCVCHGAAVSQCECHGAHIRE